MTNLDQRKPGEKSGKSKKKKSKKAEQKSPKPEQVLAAEELTDATTPSGDFTETEAAEASMEIEQAAAVAPVVEAVPVEEIPPVVEAAPVEEIAPALEAAPVEETTPPAPAAPAEPVARVASFKERMASVMPPAETAPGKPPAPADVAPPVPAPQTPAPAAPPADIARAVPSPAAAPVGGIQAIANAYRDYTRKSLEDAQSFAEKLSTARSLDKAVEAQAEFAKKACENFAADSRKIRELHRELFWQAFRLPNWPLGKNR
jgi:phasin family protein